MSVKGGDNPRRRRLAQLLRDHLSEMIQREVKDPRIEAAGLVTINHVEVAADLGSARVHVSFFGGMPGPAVDEAVRGLQSAAGFLRGPLGKRMHLPRVPELHFVHDDSPAFQQRLTEIVREDEATVGEDGAPGGDEEDEA